MPVNKMIRVRKMPPVGDIMEEANIAKAETYYDVKRGKMVAERRYQTKKVNQKSAAAYYSSRGRKK